MPKNQNNLAQSEDDLSRYIPEMIAATAQAFEKTISSGIGTVVAEEGDLIFISPDGTRSLIGKIEAPSHGKIGEKIRLKWS